MVRERERDVEAPEAPPQAAQQAREAGYAAEAGAPIQSIFLTPVAAPAILGLFGFAAAQAAVAAGLIGAYAAPVALFIGPFAGMLGGVAQFAAAMWAFRARDGLGTGMLGVWGAYWIGYGILQLLFATGVLAVPGPVFVGLAVVFGTLAAITYVGAVAAAGVNLALTATLFLLASGAAVGSAAYATGGPTLTVAAGWVFLFAAAAGWYTASGLLLNSVYHRTVFPLGLRRRPGDITSSLGEPGIF